MRWSKHSLILAIGIGTVVLFAMLVTYIFGLSSASGSNFAPYSTYRSDPQGMMAVYNALDHVDGYQVERYIQDFESLPVGSGATLIIAGTDISPDPVPVLDAVEAFAATGGRVVIAFFPLHEDSSLKKLETFIENRDHPKSRKSDEKDATHNSSESASQDPVYGTPPLVEPAPEPGTDPDATPSDVSPDKKGDTSDKDHSEPDDALEEGPPLQDISERWEFKYGFEKPLTAPHFGLLDSALPVDPQFSGHSGLYFTPVAPERWKVVYGTPASGGEPLRAAVMEHKIGAGSVVLCSDSFFLSNEALHKHYDPRLLSWIIGEQPRVLFSEVHLGTQQQDRIMTLVRRYRLHGVVFGLVLMAVLFVWHNGATLVPRQEISPRKGPTTTAERSHQDGLDNLLARFIPPDQLLNTCVREWSQQFHNDLRGPAIQRLAAGEHTATRDGGGKIDLVATYNEIARELHRK